MDIQQTILNQADSAAGYVGLTIVVVLGALLLIFLLSPQEKRRAAMRKSLWGLSFVILVALAVAVGYGKFGLEPIRRWMWSSDTVEKLVWTILVVTAVVLATGGLTPVLSANAKTLQQRHKVRRTIEWVRTAVILVTLLVIWGARVENLGVFLGIVGAGLALSLQELLLSIAGWAYVMLKKPVDIGDRIEIKDMVGDVIDIGLLHTTLVEVGNWVKADQSTGRLLVVPNSSFLRHSVYNYTKGFPFVWNELTAIVTFESDWQRAKELILELSQEEDHKIEAEVQRQMDAMQESYAIMKYRVLTSIVYTKIADNGIALTLRYLTPVRARRTTEHKLNEGILLAFSKEPTIDFAYPTTRFYQNQTEGKVRGFNGEEEQKREEKTC